MGTIVRLFQHDGIFAHRARFFMLILVTLCLMFNWANILSFNFTVICMGPHGKGANISDIHEVPTVGYGIELTPHQKSFAMAAVAIGALIANFPIIILINKYGPRYLFAFVGLLGAGATATIPVAMKMGYTYFLIARGLQGIAFAGDMATFGSFINTWTYYKQVALFTATLCVYVQIAPVFTNPISGLLCSSSFGWPAVYYVHAAVSTVLFLTFLAFYRNFPEQHPLVTDVENEKIQRGQEKELAETQKHIPYMAILKSPQVWAVFIGAIGNFAGINFVYQFSPTYLNKVQGYEILETGFVAALPPLLEAICKEMAGVINDKITFINETVKTKVFNTISFVSFSAFIIALAYIPPGNGSMALIILTAGTCFLGFNIGGFYKSGSLISGPYAPVVMGQVSNAITIMILTVPLYVNPITIDNTPEQWRLAFFVTAAIMIACNIFYCIFASGEPCYWAKQELHENIDNNKNLAFSPAKNAPTDKQLPVNANLNS
uniref:Major facilitator superfamily (MFS) profile domain-containing protein n=1 Tax=Panagrolaimus sp. ES5 TaxID=591445 RepID=A0AC34F0A9_9BILA